MSKLETDLRVISNDLYYVLESVTCFKNLLGLKVEDIEIRTDLFIAREKLGAIIMTLPDGIEILDRKQKILFVDARDLVDVTKKHIRWLLGELGVHEESTTEKELTAIMKKFGKIQDKD